MGAQRRSPVNSEAGMMGGGRGVGHSYCPAAVVKDQVALGQLAGRIRFRSGSSLSDEASARPGDSPMSDEP